MSCHADTCCGLYVLCHAEKFRIRAQTCKNTARLNVLTSVCIDFNLNRQITIDGPDWGEKEDSWA